MLAKQCREELRIRDKSKGFLWKIGRKNLNWGTDAKGHNMKSHAWFERDGIYNIKVR